MAKTRERDEFVEIMALEFGDVRKAFEFADAIVPLARRHHRLQERICNGELEWHEDSEPAPDEKLEEKIRRLCAAVGVSAVFSGDPRGATVKLKVKSGRTNDWGGVGICVPT